MKTFVKAIRLPTTICKIFCVMPLRLFGADSVISSRKKIVILSYLQLALFASAVCVASAYDHRNKPFRPSGGTIESLTSIILGKFRVPGYLILLAFLNFRIKPAAIIVARLNTVNEAMTRIGPGVDFNKLHHYARKYTALAIAKILVLVLAAFIDDRMSFRLLIDLIAYGLPVYTSHLVVLQWSCAVHTITLHFNELNNILKSLKYRHCFVVEDFRCKQKVSASTAIKISGTLLGTLYQQCATVMEAFSLPIVWILWSEFVFAIFHTYRPLTAIGDGVTPSCKVISADIAHFIVFVELILPCIFCMEEATKFKEILNRLSLKLDRDEYLADIINNINMQPYQEQVSFSAYGLFSLDGRLLYVIIGSLLTYLVILLQFD